MCSPLYFVVQISPSDCAQNGPEAGRKLPHARSLL